MSDNFGFDEYGLDDTSDIGGFVSDFEFEGAFSSDDVPDKSRRSEPNEESIHHTATVKSNLRSKHPRGYPDKVVHKAQEMASRDPRVKQHTKNQVRPRNQASNSRPHNANSEGRNIMQESGNVKSKQGRRGSKKKSKMLLFAVPVLAVVGVGLYLSATKLEPQIENYETSGRYAYDTLQTALQSYDAEAIDSIVGSDDGDSYLSQEWSYANSNELRENFIKIICANTSFKYPQVPQLSTTGKEMTKGGEPILVLSSMNNGEEVTVSHVDYSALSEAMKEDKELILEMYKKSGISDKDYDYEDAMADLMLEYIVSKGNLPLTESNITLGVSTGSNPTITDDTNLDKLLFSSDEFHNMCDIFSQVVTGFTGYTTEKYTVKEEQANPEYTQWKIRFDKYYKDDNGKFVKGVSKWEPWYLRDSNNNYVLDENGNRIVNYYSIKDDQGNDWIQPSKTVLVDVEKERQVEVAWEKDSVIPYCFLGAYYCQNEYNGKFSSDVRVGDGSVEAPAGVGTPIITKVLGTDGEYHDIKVTMTGYWIGEDAINYAIGFSEKNRGFDVNSVVQLICYELKIENLEDKAFTFESEMFLADSNSNKSTRTGTMYGFQSRKTVKAGESVIINDWATSTELDQKYVCWGSSFKRVYDVVYFKVLAGTGEIPKYSAYKAFTGESTIEEEESSNDTEETLDDLSSGDSDTESVNYN